MRKPTKRRQAFSPPVAHMRSELADLTKALGLSAELTSLDRDFTRFEGLRFERRQP